MKPLLLLLLISPFGLLAQDRYYYFSGDIENETQLQKALNSQRYIDIDINKGALTGFYDSNQFKALYDIKSTGSGFVKGFNYNLDFGYLQRDVVNSIDFNRLTDELAKAHRFYFYPDMLAAPKWHFVEIFVTGSSKLVFIRKH